MTSIDGMPGPEYVQAVGWSQEVVMAKKKAGRAELEEMLRDFLHDAGLPMDRHGKAMMIAADFLAKIEPVITISEPDAPKAEVLQLPQRSAARKVSRSQIPPPPTATEDLVEEGAEEEETAAGGDEDQDREVEIGAGGEVEDDGGNDEERSSGGLSQKSMLLTALYRHPPFTDFRVYELMKIAYRRYPNGNWTSAAISKVLDREMGKPGFFLTRRKVGKNNLYTKAR